MGDNLHGRKSVQGDFAMAAVILDCVSKRFGDVRAVDDISMQIRDGEFIALLGSSGCGKTTILRLLAGFEPVSQGTISIDGKIVSSVKHHILPEKRQVGMVFQAYALWPHMNVRENVGFSLRIRRIPKSEQSMRVNEALEAVGLSDLADRKPADLSGGQRQRVALARCLVMEASLVLLDEPLANLDVNLRESMLDEFCRFHRKTGSTMVYVTHDQAEAMALADRIIVMERGRFLQEAPPDQLYNNPVSEIVARFVGKGMVIPVRISGKAGKGRFLCDIFGFRTLLRGNDKAMHIKEKGAVQLACLRSENLHVSKNGSGFPAIVDRYIYHGGAGTVYLNPVHAPEYSLRVLHRGHIPEPGKELRIIVDDGWIIPSTS